MQKTTIDQQLEDAYQRITALRLQAEALEAQPQTPQAEILAELSATLTGLQQALAAGETLPPDASLRQQAEAAVQDQLADVTRLSADEIRILMHELQVHQIELEMQNTTLRETQLQLEESRDRYVNLYDLAPVGYLTLSEKNLILEVNLTGATMLGMDRRKLLNRPLSRFIVPEDQDIYYLHRHQLFETGQPQECDLRLVRPDGTRFYGHIKGIVGQDSAGRPLCRAVVSDITKRKQAQEALQESEARYRMLFEMANDFVLLHKFGTGQDAGYFIEANEFSCRRLGYTLEEMRQLGPVEIITDADRKNVPVEAERLADAQELIFEKTLVTKTGELIPVELHARIFEYQGQKLALSIGRDITERKRAETELRQSQQFIQSVADIIPNQLYVFDLVERQNIYINNKVEEFFGLTLPELQAKGQDHLFEMIHPDDVVDYLDQFNIQWKEAEDGQIFEKEYRLLNARGEYRWIRSYEQVLNRNADGSPMQIVGLAADITERRQAEDKIRFQAHLLDTVGQAAIATTMEGNIIYWNRFAETLYGWPAAEVMGRNISDVTVSQASHEQAAEIMARFQTGKSWEGEFPVQRRDGTIFPAFITNAPIHDEQGQLVGIIGVSTDITERKRAENELKESKQFLQDTLDALASNISILDETGTVIAVNAAWRSFGQANDISLKDYGLGVNYLEICDSATGDRSTEAPLVAQGIRNVMANKQGEFSLDYPCHNPGQQSWFNLRATRFDSDGSLRVVVAHTNITERKLAEQAVRHSEGLLKNAAEIARLGYYRLDIQTGQADWSEETFRIFGRDPSEDALPIDTYQTLLHPDDRATLNQLFDESIKAQKPFNMIYRILRPGGEIRHVHSLGNLETDPEDGTLKMFGTLQDITEQIQAQELLKESEANLKKAQQVARIGNWIWTISTNQLEWSDEMYRLFGIKKEEFSGDLADVMQKAIHPDDRAKVEQSNLSVINDGKPMPLEYRIVHPDGSVRTVWAEAGELVLDEAGNPAILTGIVQDITERKQAEEELIKAHLLLESMGRVAKIGGWEVDLITMEPHFSAETFNIYELPPPTPPPVEDGIKFYAPESQSIIRQAVNDAIEKHIPYDLELPFITAKGRNIWVRAQGRIYLENGKAVRLYGSLQDITERKEAEAALMESEEKYRQLFGNAEVGMFRTQLDGSEILDFNDKFLTIFDKTREEMWGKPSVPLWADPDQRAKLVQRLEREDRVTNFEVGMLNKRGEVRNCLMSLRIYRDQRILEGSIQDITELKWAEAEQKRLHEQVKRHAAELEQRVQARTADLRQFVNLMADREIRMAELKEVIKQLKAQLAAAGLEPVADDPLAAGIE